MRQEKNRFKGIRVWFIALFLALGFSTTAMAQTGIKLSDQQVENLVRRSYQYVAMYNVIQKFALDPASGGLFADGFNKPVAATALADHTMKYIPRPNNDTFYQRAILDLRHDPVIVEYPSIDSKYLVLESSGYDHYAGVPLASSNGDFKKPVKLLFYTDRTKGYRGQKIKGVDRIVKTDGDFVVVFLRAMPFQGKPAKDDSAVKFPALYAFEEIQVIGSVGRDTFIVSDLTNTSISQSTIYFDGQGGRDTLDASATDRRIVADGGKGRDDLTGGAGDDELSGGDGRDMLGGLAGEDILDGGDAPDVLIGGLDDDMLTGGGERDPFISAPGDGNDTITDIEKHELIDLIAYGFDDEDDVLDLASQDGADTVIALSETDSIRLADFAFEDVHKINFIV